MITNLSKRLDSIEWSQQLISDTYDSVLKSMQSIKKQIKDLNNWCEVQDNKINYSQTSPFRSPKGNEKKIEIAGLRNNRGSVKGKSKSKGIRSSFEIAGTSN